MYCRQRLPRAGWIPIAVSNALMFSRIHSTYCLARHSLASGYRPNCQTVPSNWSKGPLLPSDLDPEEPLSLSWVKNPKSAGGRVAYLSKEFWKVQASFSALKQLISTGIIRKPGRFVEQDEEPRATKSHLCHNDLLVGPKHLQSPVTRDVPLMIPRLLLTCGWKATHITLSATPRSKKAVANNSDQYVMYII